MRNINELIISLEDLEVFLSKNGFHGYSQVIKDLKFDLIKGNDDCDNNLLIKSVNELKHYSFGAMGSLTDLIISKKNNHLVEDEASANKKYWELLLELQKRILTLPVFL